jgi:hypothetical protein
MSFEDWVKNGWLETHRSSREEIQNLLRIVRRDVKDSQSKDVSNDWRFAIAYNAALQAATAALAASGYRASRETTTIGSSSLLPSRSARAQNLFEPLTRFERSETSVTMTLVVESRIESSRK